MKPDKTDDDMDDYVDITTGNYIIDITTTAVSDTDKDNKDVITTVGPIVQDEVIETTTSVQTTTDAVVPDNVTEGAEDTEQSEEVTTDVPKSDETTTESIKGMEV